jgi:hypothetical protein
MLIWLGLAVWLMVSGLNLYLLYRFDLFARPHDVGSLVTLGLVVLLGPVTWLLLCLVFVTALGYQLAEELLYHGYEQLVLPHLWPRLIRRHDAHLTRQELADLPLELRGHPKFELAVSSGGPLGGGGRCYQVTHYTTYWYGPVNAKPSEAVVLYCLRYLDYHAALAVRTDLWHLRQQQPAALIVWSPNGQPTPLLHRAIADLADAIIVGEERLELKVWCTAYRPELLPFLSQTFKC